MLPLEAGSVCCEEMVAGWRQREMVVGLGRRGRVPAGYLTPASLIGSASSLVYVLSSHADSNS
jgi:hypothetical protein